MLYLIEQCLNGIQLGMLLFLLAAGLTLIFGIMDLVNLAHGSLYMLGAYFAATFAARDRQLPGRHRTWTGRDASWPEWSWRSSRYGRSMAGIILTMCSAPSGC